MKIKTLTLNNYRNIASADIAFSDGMNVFFGENGQGKTNLLEAASMFALGRSFRGAKDREVIGYGKDCAELTMELCRDDGEGRPTLLNIRYGETGRRVCRKNGVCVRSLAEFVGNLRVVLFASPQIAIVRESAAARRLFLDQAISQIKPVYLERLSKMNKLLAERNKLIKQLAENPSPALHATLEPWTLQFARESAFVSSVRKNYVGLVSGFAAEVMRDISSERELLTLDYPEPPSCEALFERLMSTVDREICAGVTLVGAHREDMAIAINGRDARTFASQGQQRSAALALKFAEGAIIEKYSHDRPVYLLDDVLSELDYSRREYVLANMSGRQVVLTVCDNNVSGDAVYRVEDGGFTAV